jgi:hypothetical protein
MELVMALLERSNGHRLKIQGRNMISNSKEEGLGWNEQMWILCDYTLGYSVNPNKNRRLNSEFLKKMY